MVSGAELAANIASAARLIARAAAAGAKLVALPENFALLGRREQDKLAIAETDGSGPIQDFLADAAARHGVYLAAGTIPLRGTDPARVRAACLLYGPDGQRLARYDKIHLFDVAVGADGGERYRESASIEPGDVTAQLLGAAQETPAFCAHLHVPLQSGSDAVLARMGRPYDIARYTARIEAARAAFPGIAISTDIIVGFPGETDAEFAGTLAFAEGLGFSRLHVFRYSQRAGTRAAGMPGQVPATVRAERSAALRALGERLALAYTNAQVDRVLEVLVERASEGIAEGTTREYVRARAASASARPGQLLGVMTERVDPGPLLTGTVLP
jgi:tRNA A37 methylthiotransferase MiaB